MLTDIRGGVQNALAEVEECEVCVCLCGGGEKLKSNCLRAVLEACPVVWVQPLVGVVMIIFFLGVPAASVHMLSWFGAREMAHDDGVLQTRDQSEADQLSWFAHLCK